MKWVKIKQNSSYSINEFGDIRNNKTGKIKVPFVNKKTGYKTVDLWNDNKSTKFTVHRLLAEAFIPNPEKKPTVDHKDGNRLNNSLENLRWATYAEQNSRFDTVGVRSEKIKVTHYSEKTKKNGVHVSWICPDSCIVFDRISDAADYFGVCLSSVSQMLKKGTIGRRGKTRGYLFEYLD